MIFFDSDYQEGCHPLILKEMEKSNMIQYHGYGDDFYTKEAAKIIREKTSPNADVHLISGGTQTNLIAIKSALRPHEAVISATSGHIEVNETAAVESTGHKILTVDAIDGKIDIEKARDLLENRKNDPRKEHKAKPKMIYISQPTEIGTIYSKKELMDLRKLCDDYGIYLFVDGARLSYALESIKNDVSMKDLYELSDLFYIGGTKCGAMMGEALVIRNDLLKEDFRYHIKQNGAMLAKGRFLGVQFYTLLKDDLYTEIAKKANEYALSIRKAFEDKNIKCIDSYTNQQFFYLTKEMVDKLLEDFSFEYEKEGEYYLSRFCTSWATKEEYVNKLIHKIKEL